MIFGEWLESGAGLCGSGTGREERPIPPPMSRETAAPWRAVTSPRASADGGVGRMGTGCPIPSPGRGCVL